MATPSWARQFTCTWFDKGRLDMSGFPENAPACLTLYLTSIRSEEWKAALEMIQDGEGHCFANETGILFSKDYESSSESSSEEEEEEQDPLPEDEVAFFAGCFPKDRVKKTVFLNIMETCLEERRKQCKCPALDCEKQFLDYVHRETKSKGATGQETTGQESKGTSGGQTEPSALAKQQRDEGYLLFEEALQKAFENPEDWFMVPPDLPLLPFVPFSLLYPTKEMANQSFFVNQLKVSRKAKAKFNDLCKTSKAEPKPEPEMWLGNRNQWQAIHPPQVAILKAVEVYTEALKDYVDKGISPKDDDKDTADVE